MKGDKDMKEIWKEVYGFNVLYEVSNLGRIRTKYNSSGVYGNKYNYLNGNDNGHGYLRFNWKSKHSSHTVYIHRLVAEAFLDNPNGFTDVNHKDENKRNNAVNNLEWCDHKYNSVYGTKIKRTADKLKRKVKCIETGIVYDSLGEASLDYSVCKTAISNCLNGRSKTCAGKRWEYV